MKKIFTLTTALATVAAANAIQNVNNVTSYAPVGEQMDFVVKSAQKAEHAKAVVATATKANVKASVEKAPNAADINPLYAFPNGAFYSFIGINAANGMFTYPGSVILPAYAENVWSNMSWYLNDAGRPTIASDGAYTWETIVNGETTNSATTYDFSNISDPALRAGYGSYTHINKWRKNIPSRSNGRIRHESIFH